MGIGDFFSGDSGGQIMSRDIRATTNKLGKIMKNQLGQGAEVYQGPLVPGTNPQIEAALAGYGGLLEQDPAVSAGLSQLLSGAGDPEAVRRYYEESVLAPSQLAFNDQLQQIGDTYGSTWGTSGAMPRMMADATARFGTGIGSVLGDLVFQDRNAAIDRIGSGIGLSLNNQQTQAGMLNNVLGMGDYSRGIAGEQNQADYSKWLSGQDYNNPWLGFLGTALSTAQPSAPQASGLEKGIGIARTILPF